MASRIAGTPPQHLRSTLARSHETPQGPDAVDQHAVAVPPLRRAGVGIGGLYHNLPTREALVEAAYLSEVEHLCAAAEELFGGASAGSARELDGALRLA